MKPNVLVPNGKSVSGFPLSPNFNILYSFILLTSIFPFSVFPIAFSNIDLIGEMPPIIIVTKEDINIPKNIRNPEKSLPKNEDIIK
jgi:hypothetical protein